MREKFEYAIVKDPKIFKLNVLPAHSDHTVYRSREELRLGRSSLRQSLDGVWKFHYARNYAAAVPSFEALSYDARSWEDIRVPAHIQMEGYDVPAYVNTQYPWDGRDEIEPGEIPESFNPVASYVKYFTIPEEMRGRRLYISFQGVESGFALFMNGSFVGYSEDSFTPSEFELTPFLTEGEQKLAVQVFKWTASSWLEDQDFYRFSGIFREVILFTLPEIHVYDLRIRALLDSSLTKGELELRFQLTKAAGKIRYTLSREGRTAVRGTADCLAECVEINAQVESPALWSAENPALYVLDVEILGQDGAVQEVFQEAVGFRRFELKDGLMLLNGKRIVFHGVNRHEFSCDRGRVPKPEEVRQDIICMKRNNIDAVRTSHYPDASDIYRLCDEYGLYMIAENNMESHGIWDLIERGEKPIEYALPGNREEYLPMLLDRVNSTYQRDKNHPSVLIWSIGNESFGGKDTERMADFFRKEDPYRLVHYEGTAHDRRYPNATDMESQMYISVPDIERFLGEHGEKPFILCEYAHAMGNSNGAMHKYTELSDREVRYQGGFIWDFVDQSLRRKNRYGEEYQAYGGDCGERPTDYDFSGNGIIDGKRQPYDKMQEVKYNYQGLRITVERESVTIRNRFLFTDLSAFDGFVRVERNGELLREQPFPAALPPLSERSFSLLPYLSDTTAGEYAVTVSFRLRERNAWAEAGHEIAFGQGVYEIFAPERPHRGKLTVIHGGWNIGVRGADFDILLSRLQGGIVSYRYAGKELILELPRPNFWRAPTSNDKGNQMAFRYGTWKLASLYQTSIPPEAKENPELMRELMSYPKILETEDYVEVCFKKWLPTGAPSTLLVTYRIFGDAAVRVTMDYAGDAALPPMPEFSFLMKLDADYRHLRWYGLGPAENYCDRRSGARLGIYEKEVSDNVQPYLVPQESGNRTGVRWAELTDDRGRGIRFSGVREENGKGQDDPYASRPGTMELSAIPYTPEQLEEARHPYELPRVFHTVVRAGLKQMGVAGDDSWGARTHEEYLVDARNPLHFTFEFRGI